MAADYDGPLTQFKDQAMDETIKKGKKPKVPPPKRRPKKPTFVTVSSQTDPSFTPMQQVVRQ